MQQQQNNTTLNNNTGAAQCGESWRNLVGMSSVKVYQPFPSMIDDDYHEGDIHTLMYLLVEYTHCPATNCISFPPLPPEGRWVIGGGNPLLCPNGAWLKQFICQLIVVSQNGFGTSWDPGSIGYCGLDIIHLETSFFVLFLFVLLIICFLCCKSLVL